jgi:hypothetical protein
MRLAVAPTVHSNSPSALLSLPVANVRAPAMFAPTPYALMPADASLHLFHVPGFGGTVGDGTERSAGPHASSARSHTWRGLLSKASECQHPGGCSKRATYGKSVDQGGGQRLLCAKHRSTKAHVDLNRKRCRHPEGCEEYAYYQAAAVPTGLNGAGGPSSPSTSAAASKGPAAVAGAR